MFLEFDLTKYKKYRRESYDVKQIEIFVPFSRDTNLVHVTGNINIESLSFLVQESRSRAKIV